MHTMPSLAEFLETDAGSDLTGLFREQSLPAGKLLLTDDRDQILIVRRGRLRVYLATEDRELSLTYLQPGDAFSTHTRAALSAQKDSLVLLAPRKVIEQQLGAFPPLQAAVIRVLATTLGQTMTMIEDLAFHRVRGRISRYLIRCLKRQRGALASGAEIRLDLGIEEIAALLGTTRQTASTELNAMVHEGAISRQGRRSFVLLQPEKLSAWAGEDGVSG